MDLKHILCQPTKEETMITVLPPPTSQLLAHAVYQQSMDQWRHGSRNGCHPYPRKRVHSAHYPTSPLLSYLQEDIGPLTSSVSTSMIATPSLSSTLSSPTLSPSSSSVILPSPALSVNSIRRRSTSTSHVNQQQKKSSHPDLPQTRTPWTPGEDYLLQKGYEQGLSWAMISATHLPHRSRGCCGVDSKPFKAKTLFR